MADRHFLAEARHAFLIRRPEKIAASFYALAPDMSVNTIGLEIMCELQAAVGDAGGNPSVVIDPPAGTRMSGPAPASGLRSACTRTVENSAELARFAAHHRPFYERLYAQRLDVTPWEHGTGP